MKVREEELKMNEAATLKLKFAKIASFKATEEVSCLNIPLQQVKTKEVYVKQNNKKMVIERSQPMNETL